MKTLWLALWVLGISLCSAFAASLGTVRDFDVLDFELDKVMSASATVRATALVRPGLALSVWVENSLYEDSEVNGLNSLRNPSSVSENRSLVLDDFTNWMNTTLVPAMEGTLFEIQEVTNSPSPGLNILLVDLKDGFSEQGSFVAAHFLPQDQNPDGGWNGMNLIYLDLNPGTLGISLQAQVDKRRTYMELTRVLSRLIHYQQDGDEENWIYEGVSQYSIYRFLAEQKFPRSNSIILDAPTTAPVEVNTYLKDLTSMKAGFTQTSSNMDRVRIFPNPREPADNRSFASFRGFSYLFFTYLFQRGGGHFRSRVSDGDRLFRSIMSEALDGFNGLEQALLSRNLDPFFQVYKDFFLSLQLETTEEKYQLASFQVPTIDYSPYPLLDQPEDPPVYLLESMQPSIIRLVNSSGETNQEIHFSAPSGLGNSDARIFRKDALGGVRVERVFLNSTEFEYLPPEVEKWLFLLNLENDSRNFRVQFIQSRFTEEVPTALYISNSSDRTLSRTATAPSSPFVVDSSLVPSLTTTANLILSLGSSGIYEFHVKNDTAFPLTFSLEKSVISTRIGIDLKSESLASLSSLVPVTDEKVVILREGSQAKILFHNENTSSVNLSLFVNAFLSSLYSTGNENSATDQDGLSSEELNALAGGGAGGCFIATASFGTPMHPAVQLFCRFRDQYLSNNAAGRALIGLYYTYSPPLADRIARSGSMMILVQVILTPLLGIVMILFHPIWFVVLLGMGFLLRRFKRGRA